MQELKAIFELLLATLIASVLVYVVFAIYFQDINFMKWPEPTSGNFWIMFFLFNIFYEFVMDTFIRTQLKRENDRG